MQELDSQDPMHKEFWDALMVIAEVELQEAVKQDELDWARLRGEAIPAKYTVKEAGLHEAVDSDVQMMLAGRILCFWGGGAGGERGCRIVVHSLTLLSK